MRAFVIVFLLFFCVTPLSAQEPRSLPRFAALRSDMVNLRTGPGFRYPIDWVLTRRNMPVEITDVYEQWRKIRLIDETEGWVHQTALSGKRHFIAFEESILYRKAGKHSPVIAYIDAGVQMKMVACPKKKDFCEVDVEGIKGYISRASLYGLYPHEFTK